MISKIDYFFYNFIAQFGLREFSKYCKNINISRLDLDLGNWIRIQQGSEILTGSPPALNRFIFYTMELLILQIHVPEYAI